MKEMVTRHDSQGSGDYRSSRGIRKHKGRDYLAVPGQPFPCFITGTYERAVRVYQDTKEYTGVVVQGEQIRIKMFYLRPTIKVGSYVRRGDPIGIVQDISKRYPPDKPIEKMKPHVHVEIRSMDPDLLIKIYDVMDMFSIIREIESR